MQAGTLEIQIVAEIAKLQADMERVKKSVGDMSTDVARKARAANDNLSSIGKGASAGIQQFSREIVALKASLDPAWAATQRYNQEVDLLRRGLDAGAISLGQFASANARARQTLSDAQAEIRAASAGVGQFSADVARLKASLDPAWAATQRYEQELAVLQKALQQGAISQGVFATEAEKLKVASQNAGRQLSETGGTSRMMAQQFSQVAQQVAVGGNAIQALATQLPDIAVGMSMAGKEATGFAAFLGSGWGIALTSAIAVAAAFASKLFETGDAADKTKSKMMTLGDALTQVGAMSKEAAKAIDDYNEAQGRARDGADRMIKVHLEEAEAVLKVARAKRESLQADLDAQENAARQFQIANPDTVGSDIGVGFANKALAANQAEIDKLAEAARNLRIDDARRDAEAAIDPIKAINNLYDDMRDKAIAAAAGNDALSKSLKAMLTDIEKRRKSALDGQKPGNQQFGREIDMAAAQSIAASAGFHVTSGQRSRAEQQRLYDTVRTAENPVALPGTSAHERGNALDIAFGSGVSPQSIAKAYADAGIKLTKILKETGHFHIEWSTSGADKAQREAEAIARKQKELAEFGAQAAETIAQINERFNEQPRLVDSAAAATRKLDATIKELSERKPPGFQQMIADAQAAKATIEDALVRPFRELTRDSERRLQIQGLIAKGREDEADALTEVWRKEETIGTLTADQVQRVKDVVLAEKQRSRELERQKALFDAQLDVLDQAKKSLTDILSGRSTNFFKDMKQAFMDLQGKRLFDSLFGDLFQQLEDELRGQSPLGRESQRFANEMSVATNALGSFTTALQNAGAGIAANDNGSPINVSSLMDNSLSPMNFGLGGVGGGVVDPSLVDGNEIVVKRPVDVSSQSIVDMASKISDSIVAPFEKILAETFGPQFAQMLGGVMSGFLAGKMTGGTTGGILGALKGLVDKGGIFGGASGQVSAALGKAMGGAAAGTMVAGISKALGIGMSKTGAQIGGAIGSFIPIPGGEIIGAIAGGLIGKAFKKTDKGYARGTIGEDGTLSYDFAKLHGKGRTGAARTLVEGLYDGLNSIADQLGGGLAGNFSLGSIGTYKKKYTYDPTPGTAADTQYFSTAEEAIKAGIMDAIDRGVLTGIRASTVNILKSGKDMDKALQDAVTFENVFKELKSIKDPLGYALDNLTTQFDALRKIFDEAGASAEEYAQLQELLTIKQQQAADAASQKVISDLSDQNSLEVQIMQLLGQSEDALALSRLHELSALQASLRPMQAIVYQLQDAQAVIDKFGPLADDLKAFKDQLLGAGGIGDSLGTLATKFRATAASAQMGDATALGNLQADASAYLDAVKANASSELDFRRAMGEVLAATDQGIFAAETQVDYAQAQIDAIAANTGILTELKDELATYQQALVDQGEWVQRQFRRWDSEGIRIQNDADTPIFTEAAA